MTYNTNLVKEVEKGAHKNFYAPGIFNLEGRKVDKLKEEWMNLYGEYHNITTNVCKLFGTWNWNEMHTLFLYEKKDNSEFYKFAIELGRKNEVPKGIVIILHRGHEVNAFNAQCSYKNHSEMTIATQSKAGNFEFGNTYLNYFRKWNVSDTLIRTDDTSITSPIKLLCRALSIVEHAYNIDVNKPRTPSKHADILEKSELTHTLLCLMAGQEAVLEDKTGITHKPVPSLKPTRRK